MQFELDSDDLFHERRIAHVHTDCQTVIACEQFFLPAGSHFFLPMLLQQGDSKNGGRFDPRSIVNSKRPSAFSTPLWGKREDLGTPHTPSGGFAPVPPFPTRPSVSALGRNPYHLYFIRDHNGLLLTF